MSYLFTSESVSEGHPDKISDQISDALLDEFLRHDPNSRVACETLVTTGLVVCAGEVHTKDYIDIQSIVRNVIRDIGYTKSEYKFDADSCGIISTIHEQSSDIRQGVDRENIEDQGAGDQGMMFGMAIKGMNNYMPIPIELSHIILQELAAIRKEKKEMLYLRPDSKSQVTVEYEDNGKPKRIHTIVISTQHDDFLPTSPEYMHQKIEEDIKKILLPRVSKNVPEKLKYLFNNGYKLYVNPTGSFIIGGPHGDTGLSGRKIIVDTYGGMASHGGGSFSGKDLSKVDRSAAYAARHIAKNLVAAGVADEVHIQLSYAIGVSKPLSIFIDTKGSCKLNITDDEIAEKVNKIFDLKPYQIIKRLKLKNPIFLPTATYGHFGRDHYIKKVEVFYDDDETFKENEKIYKNVEFFTWEKLDYIDIIKNEFKIN